MKRKARRQAPPGAAREEWPAQRGRTRAACLGELPLKAFVIQAETLVLQAEQAEGGAEGGELREDRGQRVCLVWGRSAAIVASAGRARLAQDSAERDFNRQGALNKYG